MNFLIYEVIYLLVTRRSKATNQNCSPHLRMILFKFFCLSNPTPDVMKEKENGFLHRRREIQQQEKRLEDLIEQQRQVYQF